LYIKANPHVGINIIDRAATLAIKLIFNKLQKVASYGQVFIGHKNRYSLMTEDDVKMEELFSNIKDYKNNLTN
jgi:hypothetical protein